MSRFKIVNTFDRIFVSICVFLLIYAWINFFVRNLWFSFVFALILSSAILFVLFYLLEKSKTKKNLMKTRAANIEQNFLCFRLMRLKEKLEFVKNILSVAHDAKVFKDSVIFSEDTEQSQVFIATNERVLSEQSLYSIIEKIEKETKNVYIICESMNPNLCCSPLKNINIKFLDKVSFYDEYLTKSPTPLDTSKLNMPVKKTFKIILQNVFIPNKAKQYFFYGIILIFSSLILPYTTYYLIFGSLFLLFAIACKLRPIISNRFERKN